MTLFSPLSVKIEGITPLNATTRLFVMDRSLGASPGQFCNIWIPRLDEKPFSVAGDDGQRMSFAVSCLGAFTQALFTKKKGDRVGIRGPFGKSFSQPEKKRIILVGGGFGAAPLFFLGTALLQKGCEVSILFGARTKDLLFFLEESQKAGFSVFVATDDGTAGEQGRVTLPLERLLMQGGVDLVQSCGPEKMMEAVARLSQKYGVPSEISLERFMKCGFGVCGQCSCDTALVCRDGCVFSGEQALSFRDFGQFHRDAVGKKHFFSSPAT